MTPEERDLLLTVARVMRANITTISPNYRADDLRALNAVLKPFEPIKTPPVNEEFRVGPI